MNGTQRKTRQILTEAAYGGKPCAEELTQERSCAMPAPDSEPVQVDNGTGQGSLLPDQSTPATPAEPSPEPEPEPQPEPVDCEWGDWSEWNHGEGTTGWSPWETNASGDGQVRGRIRTRYSIISPQNGGKECACFSPNRDSKLEQERKRDFEEGGPDAVGGSNPYKEGECLAMFVEQLSDGRWMETDLETESRATPAEEPVVEETVVVDSGTTQDSLLPAQDSTPDTTSETPTPVIVEVNIVQQPASSGGGGGQTATTPAATTTETKDETETTTEEPEEGSKALLMVGGLGVLSGIVYWAYQKYA